MSSEQDTEYRALASPLFHYTSLDTLLKIIDSQTLHASDARYMSDASELLTGAKLIRDVAKDRMRSAVEPEVEILRQFLRWWQDPRRFHFYSIFVCCFSENGDLLSQWRGYTPPGRGVTLGFDHKAIIDRATKLGWHWTACRYQESSQRAWAGAILSRMVREAQDGGPVSAAGTDETYYTYFERLIHEFFKVSATIKNSHFEEEREWRLISPPSIRSEEIKYRPGSSMLVPYIEFPVGEGGLLDIDQVVIGPTPNPHLSFLSVANCLGRRVSWKPSDIEAKVRNSDVPYRSW